MEDKDAFQLNIDGVANLINSPVNKNMSSGSQEGIVGDHVSAYSLEMDDTELVKLANTWTRNNAEYDAKIDKRSKKNNTYYLGLQQSASSQSEVPVASNLLFEAEETFIPQAIAKNPEPVVFSDNTEEGKLASNDLKVMLQYHATEMNLKRKLGVMVRHWSIFFVAIIKHGWDEQTNDIVTSVRQPSNFILDKDGYIDESGNFIGAFLGERIQSSAEELVKLFPKSKAEITIAVNGDMGTKVVRTEWWTNEFCFTKYNDLILEKHKNEFFNYDKEDVDEYGQTITIPGQNHFAKPIMPYTFLSVVSLQRQPHDETNLIEQNIQNQDRIIARDVQIDKNLKTNNNSLIVDDKHFSQETAAQAAQALESGDPILGDPDGIKRIPANDLPGGIMDAQEVAKNALRGIFGVSGLSAQAPTNNTTAHGMVLNQEYDSTRIGGGIGDAIEATAKNIFNWLTQLYYVFYDTGHFAAAMGSGRAVEYVKLMMANQQRKFVVTVSPNSMAPKDELSEMQNAINLANAGWLDPINLFKKLNDPDPMNTAKMVTLFKIDPVAYLQQFFPQEAMKMQQSQMQQTMAGQIAPPANPGEPDISANMAAPNDLSAKTELGQQAPFSQ